jgi:hypothetical protein
MPDDYWHLPDEATFDPFDDFTADDYNEIYGGWDD